MAGKSRERRAKSRERRAKSKGRRAESEGQRAKSFSLATLERIDGQGPRRPESGIQTWL
ncbi:MAG: hypothetical protein ACOZDD_11405 [Bacteroidota bacterium]